MYSFWTMKGWQIFTCVLIGVIFVYRSLPTDTGRGALFDNLMNAAFTSVVVGILFCSAIRIVMWVYKRVQKMILIFVIPAKAGILNVKILACAGVTN